MPDSTQSDVSGHDATRPDNLHTVALPQLEVLIAEAGIAMSRRQIMRHCKAGTFDAKKLPAGNNLEHWFVAPASIEKGIADIKTLQAHRVRHDASRPDVTNTADQAIPKASELDTSGRDASRPDVSVTQTHTGNNPPQPDMSQPVTPTEPDTSRYVSQLEKRIDEKNEVISILKEQLIAKDRQITDRSERERETNILIRGLQTLVLQLQPGRTDRSSLSPTAHIAKQGSDHDDRLEFSPNERSAATDQPGV